MAVCVVSLWLFVRLACGERVLGPKSAVPVEAKRLFSQLGVILGVLGASSAILEVSWVIVGAILELTLGQLGHISGCFEEVFGPRRFQDSPRTAQNEEEVLKIVIKRDCAQNHRKAICFLQAFGPQGGPQTALRRPRTAHDQDGPKTTPRRPKMARRRPQHGPRRRQDARTLIVLRF